MRKLNRTVELLVLANLPLRDSPRIIIFGHRGEKYPGYEVVHYSRQHRRRRYKNLVAEHPWLDVTDLVRRMFKQGKLKHWHKGDITFNPNVRNTYFVEA
jgi:hypothetical protein